MFLSTIFICFVSSFASSGSKSRGIGAPNFKFSAHCFISLTSRARSRVVFVSVRRVRGASGMSWSIAEVFSARFQRRWMSCELRAVGFMVGEWRSLAETMRQPDKERVCVVRTRQSSVRSKKMSACHREDFPWFGTDPGTKLANEVPPQHFRSGIIRKISD